jgi:hypothetical protein
MKITCWYCGEPVSNEISDMFFRAIAVCPECLEKSPEAEYHPLKKVTHD